MTAPALLCLAVAAALGWGVRYGAQGAPGHVYGADDGADDGGGGDARSHELV